MTLREEIQLLSESQISRKTALSSDKAYEEYKKECEKKIDELYTRVLELYGVMSDTDDYEKYNTIDKALAWVTKICSNKQTYDEEFRETYIEMIGPKSDYLKLRTKALKLSPAQRLACAKLICQSARIQQAAYKTECEFVWKFKKGKDRH